MSDFENVEASRSALEGQLAPASTGEANECAPQGQQHSASPPDPNVGADWSAPQGRKGDAPTATDAATSPPPQGQPGCAASVATTVDAIHPLKNEARYQGDEVSAAIIYRIRRLHREDAFAIQQQTRTVNAALAYIRNVIGWSGYMPEAERDAVAKRARAIYAALGKGELLDGEDGEIAEMVRPVVMLSLETLRPWQELREGVKQDNGRYKGGVEREMARLAKILPGAAFVASVPGFGWLSFARIVGEAGDVGSYPKKGHLWKRMGLAVMDGVRQGGLSKGASAEAWIEHGYSGKRRSVMFVIGESLVKAQGPYRALYLERLAVEHGNAVAAGLTPATTGKATVESWATRGLPALTLVKKPEKDAHRSAKHMHNRAKRWIEKRLLRDLWQAWRAEEAISGPPKGPAASSSPPAGIAAAAE